MELHTVTKKIIALLDSQKFWYETFSHAEVRTSEEAAKVRPGYSLKHGAKALILKVKFRTPRKNPFILYVQPADQKLDSKQLKQVINAKEIRFATEEEVNAITDGVPLGAIPPFGNLFDLETIVDPLLFKEEKMVFNAGSRSFSIGMYTKDYQSIVART